MPAPDPQTVSLTLIVKNEAANLPGCLGGIRELVGEVIVIDTGSTDGTRAVAEKLGARVFDFEWVDNFAAARNAAIERATGRWIFWLDADDRVDVENLARLRTLFASLQNDNSAFHMACRSMEPSGAATTTDHVRLFRNRPDVRWTYRIHEQILPAIQKSGGVLRQTDVVIHHTGYADPALHRRKLERNLKLLELARAEHPGETAVLYHLGVNYTAVGRPIEALPVLEAGLAASGQTDTYARQCYGQIARAHQMIGQRAKALAFCRAGTTRFPDDAELLFTEAALLTEAGDAPAAEKRLLRLIDPTNRFVSNDTGLTGYKARQNLGMLYRRQNRLDDAARQFQQVIDDQPGYPYGRLALADLLLAQGRFDDVAPILEPLHGDPGASIEAGLMLARAHHAKRHLGSARVVLEPLLERSPGNLRVLTLLTQVLLEEGTDGPAIEKSLREILRIDPAHAAAKKTLDQLAAARR